MKFNKIEETIKSKNFHKTFFIKKVLGMSIRGFDLALDRKTLKVRDLEKITEALKLPMSYWWEEDPDLIALEPSIIYENKKAEKEILKLYQELERKNRIIDALLQQIDNPREFLAIQKLKDRKTETKTETKLPKKG
jgi:hypothetical protein